MEAFINLKIVRIFRKMQCLKQGPKKPTEVKVPLCLQLYELNGITYAKASSMGPIPQGSILIRNIPIVGGG